MAETINREQALAVAQEVRESAPFDYLSMLDCGTMARQVRKHFPEFAEFNYLSKCYSDRERFEWFEEIEECAGEKRWQLDFEKVLDKRFEIYANEYSTRIENYISYRVNRKHYACERPVDGMDEVWDVLSFGMASRPDDIEEFEDQLDDIYRIWKRDNAGMREAIKSASATKLAIYNLFLAPAIVMASVLTCEHPEFAKLPGEFGIDLSVMAYFSGVPVEYIIAE